MEKEEFRICPFCKSKIPLSLDECPVCHRIIVERPLIYVDDKPYSNQSVEPSETNGQVVTRKPRMGRTSAKRWILLSIFAVILISCATYGIFYFRNIPRTITAIAELNGSISPSGSVIVKYGTDQTFTIKPSPHYHVEDVLVDNMSVGAVTSYNFDSISKSHTIKASFAIDTNTIMASAGPNGSISPYGSVEVNYGTDQTFTIIADSRQTIISVIVDGANKGVINSYVFNDVIANHTISASFTSTITYRIGTIDPRFNISTDTFSTIVNDAAKRWNKAAGKNLLAYYTDGDVEVNLVYDYRQEYVDGMKKIDNEFKDIPYLKSEINQLETHINGEQKKYDADLKAYNAKVDYWNAYGGTWAEYYKLEAMGNDLDKEKGKLNADIDRYDNLISEYNMRVDEMNGRINALELQYNINSVEQGNNYETCGEYIENGGSKEIVIYSFDNTNELKLILMHELGHALGAEHADSTNSIMYPTITDITLNIKNPYPSKEDLSLISWH